MAIDELETFGRIAAEFEQDLAEFFVRTDAYARIEEQQRVIVVGRKGTGKTAIYEALLQRAAGGHDIFATGLSFRDYPWGAHAEISDSAAASVERYMQSWIFLALVELSKLVLTDERHRFSTNRINVDAREALERFLERNWGEVRFRSRDIFTKSKYTVDVRPQVAGTGLGGFKRESVPRARLGGFLVEANRWLTVSLEHILDARSWYFVLFDELDVGYKPGDVEYRERLIGLLLAVREVLAWSRASGYLVAPIVFIRSDIYESLSFPDKNKVTSELAEFLTWTDELEGEDSLKHLIDERIRYQLDSWRRDPRYEVFDEDLMRGTQHKAKHMAVRTHLRPRDMIQFANFCLEEAKGAGGERIRSQDVAEARKAYSRYMVSELDDEIHAAVPHWKKYLDVLRRMRTMRFTRADFEEAFTALRIEREGASPDAALETLYEYGIIGFTRIGGSGGGSAVTFSYRDAEIGFDPGAPFFRVHLGLKEALDLVDVGSSG